MPQSTVAALRSVPPPAARPHGDPLLFGRCATTLCEDDRMIISHANFLLQSDDRMTNSRLAPSPRVEFTRPYRAPHPSLCPCLWCAKSCRCVCVLSVRGCVLVSSALTHALCQRRSRRSIAAAAATAVPVRRSRRGRQQEEDEQDEDVLDVVGDGAVGDDGSDGEELTFTQAESQWEAAQMLDLTQSLPTKELLNFNNRDEEVGNGAACNVCAVESHHPVWRVGSRRRSCW